MPRRHENISQCMSHMLTRTRGGLSGAPVSAGQSSRGLLGGPSKDGRYELAHGGRLYDPPTAHHRPSTDYLRTLPTPHTLARYSRHRAHYDLKRTPTHPRCVDPDVVAVWSTHTHTHTHTHARARATCSAAEALRSSRVAYRNLMLIFCIVLLVSTLFWVGLRVS